MPLKVFPRNLLSIHAIKRLFDRMEDTEKAGRDRVVILRYVTSPPLSRRAGRFASPPFYRLCIFLHSLPLGLVDACTNKSKKARDTGEVDLNCLIVKFLTRRLRAYVMLYF